MTGGVKLAGPANTWIWGDFASGRVWTATQSGSALTNVTVAPFTVDQLASFGKDNAGTTYFISLGGVVKTLVVS